jgi:hypothetical protein
MSCRGGDLAWAGSSCPAAILAIPGTPGRRANAAGGNLGGFWCAGRPREHLPQELSRHAALKLLQEFTPRVH